MELLPLPARADKVWKAKRVEDLERLVIGRIVAASPGLEPWQAFQKLDDLLDRIAAKADARLAYQSAYPIIG